MSVASTNVITKINPRDLRKSLGLNQLQFWSKVGVTQSGGSRYEAGRRMPKAVASMLRLVHQEQIDVNSLTRADCDVIAFLKANEPELLKSLRRQAEKAKERVA